MNLYPTEAPFSLRKYFFFFTEHDLHLTEIVSSFCFISQFVEYHKQRLSFFSVGLDWNVL